MSTDQWNHVVESRDELRRKKRQALVEASASLFNKNGYEKTSLDDVAKSLGITKRTIYYYIQSKDQILMEILGHSVVILDRIAHSVERERCSAGKKVELIIDEYSRWMATDFGACLVLTRENLLTDEVRLELRSKKNRLDWLIRNAITEGIKTGEFRDSCDPRLTSAALFGALNWLPFWNYGSSATSADEISEHFKKVFIHGMMAETKAATASTQPMPGN